MESFDEERKSRLSTSRTEGSTVVTQKYLAEDRTSSVRMLQELTGINTEVSRIFEKFQERVSWYLLHHKAPTHSLGVVSYFFWAKRGISVSSQPSYSPEFRAG
jgi:hypothetical protein